MLARELKIAVRFTLLTMLALGILYPLAVSGIAAVFFRAPAEGGLIIAGGQVVGSRLIGQQFTRDSYFHGRPSAAGNGYDPLASGGSNYALSNRKWVATVEERAAHYALDGRGPVPLDLVTASGSGLDPDISPAAARFQVERVARARGVPAAGVRALVERHVQGRQFGVLGDEHVNVLLLNLELDRMAR